MAIEPQADERGFFARTVCRDEFARAGLHADFEQESISYNRRSGTLRGLHFQAEPHAEHKLVCCVRGEIFDVVVDLRPASPTYAQWLAVTLRGGSWESIYIPPGCAHGFQTLCEDVEVSYRISPPYFPSAGRGIRWNSPSLDIRWPREDPVLSERDAKLPLFVP